MSEPTSSQPPDRPDDSRRIEQLRDDLAAPLANLLDQLPDDVDTIERVIAAGRGTDDLRRMLASLPDTGDLADLDALLEQPDELRYLLADREARARTALDPDGSAGRLT